jgi:DNA polymerase-3 subunit epsilon
VPVSVEIARWRWRRRADALLKQFWSAPLPRWRGDWREAEFLVLDAEMSSLDPDEGELLSLGWVLVRAGRIELASAHHRVIRAASTVGQSATIHQLRDCEVAAGVAAGAALAELIDAARGRLLVFHHAPLDLAYLDRLSIAQHGAPLLQPHLCTLQMEKRLLERREQSIKPGDLTLSGCRRRYQLPDYHGHNALWDALATAELLLAHIARRARGHRLTLRELLR